MKVLISSRKDDDNTTTSSPTPAVNGIITNTTSSSSSHNPARIPFTTVLASASVLFLAVPLSPTTRSLLAEPELALLHPHTTIINVSRGGIVDEAAVLAALTAHKVFGYGTDVFATEPAGNEVDSCLLGAAAAGVATVGKEEEKEEKEEKKRVNLVMTGHLAWLSETTIANQMRRVGENLRAWVDGNGEGDVIVRGSK